MTQCAKCHTPCENGGRHDGLAVRTLPAGSGLPLTSDGRATCLTCHEMHPDATAPAGAGLRISNLSRGLCLACHGGEPDGPESLTIVFPPAQAVVREEKLALIGTAAGLAGDHVAITLNGVPFHARVKNGELATWLRLAEGLNRIEIAQDGRSLWRGEVFRGENPSDAYSRTTVSHCTDSREQCLGCHDGKGKIPPAGTVDSSRLCYGCHDRQEGKRYVHGPLAVGSCLVCHDPHGGFGTAHLRGEQTQLCGSCHAARETMAKAACQETGKRCADCHDPHQSDARYLLKGRQYTRAGGAAQGR
jgi:predicted CXXCH cytochrome family protein